MAFKKTLFNRLFSASRFPNPVLTPKQPLKQSLIPPDMAKRSLAPDPGDAGFFKRILQRRPIYQSSLSSPSSSSSQGGIRSMPTGDKLIQKLRGLDIARDRIRLDGLIPPPMPDMNPEKEEEEEGLLTVNDVKKLMKASEVEMIKAKLGEVERSWVSYSEFVEICKEGCYGDKERGVSMAKLLDDSGAVVVLGPNVCLRPHQVANAIQGLIPLPLSPKDPRRKELEDLEKHKFEIDRQAESLVRRELWLGLGYLVVQTAAFMRLTFWELSWDVMEPICFYVTSFYFMAGYAFFLRTSKEPSFEGFFESRFAAKQKKLMTARGFDFERYNELRKACYPHIINEGYYHRNDSSCTATATTKSFAL